MSAAGAGAFAVRDGEAGTAVGPQANSQGTTSRRRSGAAIAAIIAQEFALRSARGEPSRMDKKQLVDQLVRQLEASARAALSSRDAAAAEARDGATPDEKREDARAAHQLASLGRAQQQRAKQALADVDRLLQFRPSAMAGSAAIAVGAIVEVEDAGSGEGRTFFLAPVGAGITLTGPGGDGHLSVVTPASPVGRAVLGRRHGDIVDVVVDGDPREWAITYVG